MQYGRQAIYWTLTFPNNSSLTVGHCLTPRSYQYTYMKSWLAALVICLQTNVSIVLLLLIATNVVDTANKKATYVINSYGYLNEAF